jgi:hypothetical protein
MAVVWRAPVSTVTLAELALQSLEMVTSSS